MGLRFAMRRNSCRKSLSVFLCVLLLQGSVGISVAGASSPPGWIVDKSTHCKVWNPQPLPKESIRWFGGCSNGKAQGEGRVVWYTGSNLTSVSYGTWVDGKCEGEFKSQIIKNGKWTSINIGTCRNGKWDGTFTIGLPVNGGSEYSIAGYAQYEDGKFVRSWKPEADQSATSGSGGSSVDAEDWAKAGLLVLGLLALKAILPEDSSSTSSSPSSSSGSSDLQNLAYSIHDFGGGYYAEKIGNSDLRNLAKSIHDFGGGYYANQIGDSDLSNLAKSINDFGGGYYANQIGSSDLRNLAKSIYDFGGGYYANQIGDGNLRNLARSIHDFSGGYYAKQIN